MEHAGSACYVSDLKGLGMRVTNDLARGHVIVLCARCEPSIASAREVSRRTSAWIGGLAALARVGLSRSATRGMAAVAAHADRRVGVDVEALSTLSPFCDELPQWLHPDEHALLEGQELSSTAAALWVRKEAVLKAFGVGLAVAPSAIRVGPHNESWQAVKHSVLGTAVVQSLPSPVGYSIAVALLGLRQVPMTRLEITDF